MVYIDKWDMCYNNTDNIHIVYYVHCTVITPLYSNLTSGELKLSGVLEHSGQSLTAIAWVPASGF